MLEADMYPLFDNWLQRNTDVYMQEPLIPATCCFDFIALKGSHVIVFELKLSDARRVIRQANIAHLWANHSYAVMIKEKVHLGLKYRDLLCDTAGLMSLCMKTGQVEVLIEPVVYDSHMTLKGLRQAMIDWIIRDTINRHQDHIAAWKFISMRSRLRLECKRHSHTGVLEFRDKKY